MQKLARRQLLGSMLAIARAEGESAALAQPGQSNLIVSGADIAALLRTRIDRQHGGTGACAGVLRADRFSTVCHGVTRVHGTQQAGDRSVFQIASLTKIFTALLFSDAVTRREIALDDPLAQHLPVSPPCFEGRAITLLDLASHTSGLPLRPVSRRDRSQDNPYAGYTIDELYADVQREQLTRPPGAAFEYSNLGYGLLGAALCNRLGASYSDLIEQRILQPLAMHETRIVPTASMQRRMVQGYDPRFTPMQPWDLGALAPAGGLYSTIRDLRRFIAVWNESEGPLSQPARAMLTIARPGADPETRMGIGWRMTHLTGRTLVWSNGSGGGVRSFMGLVPGDRIGVIAFANMATGPGVDDIGFHVLDTSRPVDRRIAIDVPGGILDRYVGVYTGASGDAFTIERFGGGIAIVQGANPIPMLAETQAKFFVLGEEPTFEFGALVEHRATTLHLHQGSGSYEFRRTPQDAPP